VFAEKTDPAWHEKSHEQNITADGGNGKPQNGEKVIATTGLVAAGASPAGWAVDLLGRRGRPPPR